MTTPHPVPLPASSDAAPFPAGSGIELFPVNFTAYQHLDDLDTETHVRAIADLLAPYGVRTTEWAASAENRDRQGAESRLADWVGGSASPGSNTVLYWVGHGSARHLAHHRTPTPITHGVTPQDIAQAIGDRQLHPGNDGNWAIIVLDACFSKSFAREVHKELFTRDDEPARYLLLSSAAKGYTGLGAFTEALSRALHTTFPTRRAIGLSALGRALASDLRGFVDDLTIDDHRDQLVRLTPAAAAAVSAPLDQLAEIQAIIDQLPDDEQRHFFPKASGAELGELAWYFHGRTIQRDEILHWLHTATSGVLVVTGPAGAGKSALLGHVLLHTNTRLREVLIRNGHLTALPPGVPRPDDPFDLTAHLAGLTPARVLHLVAKAAGLTDLAEAAVGGRTPTDLTSRLLTELRDRQKPLTLLFDALDEAEQPLVIAYQLLRPLAALPTVRLIVGTRRSTREGPDQPTPDDTDLLDALRPPRVDPHGPAANGPPDVVVTRDPEAIALYLRAKLHAAKDQGALQADDTLITEAVRRLVTDQRQDGAEPQQFLYARLAAHELLNDPALLADPALLTGRTHRELFTRALGRLQRTNPHYTPLLRALGLVQGRGLPDQDGIWATAADALAPDSARTRDSIPDLLRDAAPYLALDHEHGQSVYRLAHRTFTEHFTAAPDTDRAHAAVTTALARHALESQGTPGAASQPPVVSPYTRHYLVAHARLGHTAAALHALADHPDVLDALDLTSITTNALHHGLDPNALPPAIAGTVLLQHHAHHAASDQRAGTAAGWRRWSRRLGTTYIQGTPPPAEPHLHDTGTWPPPLTTGTVQPRQLHLELTGHTREVRAVAVFAAPDGTPRLATTGNDRTVRIWNPTTGTQEGQPLIGHTDKVRAVAVFAASDGTPRLATGGEDGTVRIWNPATGTQEVQYKTGWVLAMAVFSAPDGTPRLAAAGTDVPARIWNPTTGTQEGRHLGGHADWVHSVAVFTAPDGTPRLATGSHDKTMRIWNPATGAQEGKPLTGHADWVNGVAVFTAPDGTPRLATGSKDETVRIWNPATGTQEGEPLTGHTSYVLAVAAFTAPDGTPRLTSGDIDGTIRVWNPVTGSQEGEPLTGHTHWVNAMAVFTAPDGTPRLATGSDDRTVRIWNPMTSPHKREPRTAGWTRAVAVFTAPDGTPRLATGSDDRTVRIWNPATGAQEGKPLTGHTKWVGAVAAFTAPDGTPRLASAAFDGTVRIWNPTTGTREGEPLTGHYMGLRAVAVFTAPDGSPRLASAGQDGTVRIWNPATHAQEGEPILSHISGVNAMVVFTAPDGSPRLASAGDDGTVRIWNPTTGTQKGRHLVGHRGPARAVATFSAPDGTPRLASAGEDGTVRIWNPTTSTQEGDPLNGHTDWVNAVAVFTASDDTPRIASAGKDKTIRIWNPATRTGHTLPLVDPVHALTVHQDLLIASALSGYLVIDVSSVPTDTA
ncbi:hypothetical protein ACGFX4_11505 [Kitasatospora sp. NPDC048365]|uniref:hypothetical protein n=1 Tax=Kitasatospora sp. NPDC048365 TaxID=3364050 RepID=UPI003719DD4C